MVEYWGATMKQCLNPNCIIYQHLDELPDVYVKCPQCGGQLVDSGLPSEKIASGHLFETPISRPITGADLPDELGATAPRHATAPSLSPANFKVATDSGNLYEYDYDDDEDPEAAIPYSEPQRVRWLTASKVVMAISALLLFVCLILGLALSSRLFPQSRVANSPQATETALASLRPPINSPIPILPTVPSAGYGGVQPTIGTQPAPAQPAPTSAPQQPPGNPQPAPGGSTAPPPQLQPSAGVLDAQMSVRFEGGQPVGNAPVYKAADTLHLAVQAAFGQGSVTSLDTRWYGPDGALIYQLRKEYPQPGTYYVGFTLKRSTPWPTGDYRVDIHTNDAASLSYSVGFSVIP
jgi:hypothetical protein